MPSKTEPTEREHRSAHPPNKNMPLFCA